MSQTNLYDPYIVKSRAITLADTNTTAQLISVPAGTLVEAVWLVVTTVFAGGTPSIDVGDSDDVDGWIDTTDVTETTAGTYRGDGADAVYWLGKHYAAADTIDAVVATGLTSGSAFLVARMSRMTV